MVGDTACKFRYRETEKEDYGLSIEEILNAQDAELNAWVSLKEVTRRGENGFTDNKFWSNPKKVEAKKRKVFKSLFGDEFGEEKTEEEPKRKKKMNSKRRRKEKLKNLEILEEEGDLKEEVKQEIKQEEAPAEREDGKGKKQKKRKHGFEKEKVLQMQDDRLAAYNLDPKAYKKKVKYTQNTQLKYDV